MTRVPSPGTPSGTRSRRVRTAAALLAAVPFTWGAVAGTAAAVVSGYGLVGPDPATQLGLSVPVLTAQVSGPEGSTVRAALADATISVTRPAGYSTGSQVVSLTDLSGPEPAEALLPAELLEGAHVVLGVGVGVRSVETEATGPHADTSDADTPAADTLAADGSTGGRPDSLAMQVDSPALAGATVVVLGEDQPQVLAGGSSVTLDLDGPSAVFALAPGAAPAATGQRGAEAGSEDLPRVEEELAGTSAAEAGGPAGPTGPDPATMAGALALGTLVAVGSGAALSRRAARRRSRP